MPSHRADTPADAPTALRSRSSAHPTHPTHPPLQRRRDLRTRGGARADHGAPEPRHDGSAGPDRPDEAPSPALPAPREAAGSRVAAAWATGRPADAPSPLAAGWPLDAPAAAPTTTLLPTAALPLDALPLGALPTAALPHGLPADAPATTTSVDVETVGALALDPLFLARALDTEAGPDGSLAASDGLAPVQPLRRPRGKERAQAQTTRRAAKVVAERAPRRAAATLPQAGIAGALGIATIAVPLAGALGIVHGSRPATATPHTAAAAALTPLPPFPLVATPPLTALADRRLLPDESPVVEVPTALAAPRTRVAQVRASRSAPRAVLNGCDGKVPDVTGVQNGRLPASMLCTLWDSKRQLRSDAAVALAKLNVLYTKRFGHPICFNDAYRSLAQQYRIKALRGGYAARPGTSEHGWGLAVDLCDGVDDGSRSATYGWLRANAPAYGWENPTWARAAGSGPYEPWHWEYMPGEQGQSKGD